MAELEAARKRTTGKEIFIAMVSTKKRLFLKLLMCYVVLEMTSV
jgi:hypothetical protein